jgi:disulfide bond formation protein DsbB
MSSDTWFTFFALLTVAANIATLTLWALGLLSFTGERGAQRWAVVRATLGDIGLPLAAVVAAVAMIGSLYLSEGAHLVPCKMCWYQRIGMYSLALILVVSVVRRDWHVRPYALTLAVLGGIVSIYHYSIERHPSWEIGNGSCDPTNPCTITLIWKFHYISIPFMALSAFAFVATVLFAAWPPDPDEAVTARDDGADG